MKKVILTAFSVLVATTFAIAQRVEYKIVTSVESIVPMGLGRSMMVENNESVNVDQLSVDREDGRSRQGGIRRKDARVEDITETKLLNFYSGVGINFQNIASNDAIISAKINKLTDEGWELAFITSGVESDSGDPDGKGIFITRYVFKRQK